MFVFIIYWRAIKKVKSPKGEYQYVGYGSFLKRLFIDFPRQLVYDLLTADPDYFREYGVHIVAGKQGSGKTVTVAYMLRRFQKMYPKLKVKTNFNYKHEDGVIRHWKDVVASENGIYGEIDVIDEVQNWFNSLQSKDFPVEMMTEITQQRKQRKCIIGTSQVFTRVAKPIREQTYILYEPITVFGCLTIVRKFEPVIKADSGTPDEKKFKGIFFFVHTKELRESYDTYHKIEEMAKEGFKPSDEHMSSVKPIIFQSPKK
jgi:ATP-dependent Clp protease ATP-binding subunit ClpX